MRYLVTLLFLFNAELAVAEDNAGAYSPAALATLMENIESIRTEYNVAGVSLVVVSPDKTIYKGSLGVSDRLSSNPVSDNTVFRIGSITKAFTGLALLKAQERGQIDLTKPLTDYFPQAPLTNQWQTTHPVRVEQLLEHTAGLQDLNAAEFASSDPSLSLEQSLLFNRQPRQTQWRPGVHSSYSNVGAGYAAAALERVAGKSYESIIKQDLFTPLRMSSASLVLDKRTEKNLATGYDTDGNKVIPYWHVLFRAFGAINSTTEEMGHFVQMLLNNGRYAGKQLFSPASIRRMEAPQTTLVARAGLEYGYGFGNYSSSHRGFVFHGHGGDADGYLSRYGYSRDKKLGYYLVINAFNNRALALMQEEVEDFIIQGENHPPVKEALLSVAQLMPLVGRYQAITQRFNWLNADALKADQLEVLLKDGHLYSRDRRGRLTRLYAVAPSQFRYRDETVATMAFVQNGKQMILQGDVGNYKKITKK